MTRCVPSEVHERHNPIKRSSVSSDLSPVKKKQRQSPSPSKIPTFYPDKSIPEETRILEQLPFEGNVRDTSVTGNSTLRSTHLQPTFYDLTLVDYKTRRTSSLPPEEDTVSSQLQLMLYYRLLSALLSPETFDFDALWAKQGINSRKSFSRSFVEDIGWSTGDLPELHVDLCSMVAAWVSVVHSARSCGEPLRGVAPELQIIYRKAGAGKNSSYTRQKKPETENKAADNSLEALALQEELDIAHAIEESLRSLNQEAREAITQAVIHDIKDTHAPQSDLNAVVDLSSPATDNPESNLAVQDLSLACTSNIPDFKAQPIVTEDREGS